MNRTLVAASRLSLLLLTLLGACERSPAIPVAVHSIRLAPEDTTVHVGQSFHMRVTLRDGEGALVTGRMVEWQTSRPFVVDWFPQGLITARQPGDIFLTARLDHATAVARITVIPVPVASIALSSESAQLQPGQTLHLWATLHDAQGHVLTDRLVQWTSSDSAVATISPQGMITALAPGQATITAISEGRSAALALTVLPVPVASIAITPDSATLQIGQTQVLSAALNDAAGNLLSGRDVQWHSAHPAIASVSPQGLVTGLTHGTATITASVDHAIAIAQVTVIP